MFKSNRLVNTYSKLNRDLIPTLDSPALGVNEQKRMVEDFKNLKLIHVIPNLFIHFFIIILNNSKNFPMKI